MKLTELMHARDYLAVQREAQRILQILVNNIDVRPMPTGVVKLTFTADVELLDRLSVWGCQVEDVEGLRTDSEDGADRELEEKGAPVRQSDVPSVNVFDVPVAEMPAALLAA